jgi:Zn-dependent metalloprotease
MILPYLLAIVLGWGVAAICSEPEAGTGLPAGTANQFQITRNGATNKIVFLKVKPAATPAAGTAQVTQSVKSNSATPIDIDDPAAVATATWFLSQNKGLLGITDVEKELVTGLTQRDQFGMTHVTFHQKYNGLWVLGGELKVHLGSDGLVASVSNAFVDGISLETKPAITSDDAKKVALDKWNADGRLRNEAIFDEPELLIYPASLIGNDNLGQVNLAWQVRIYAQSGNLISADETYYVDAANGNLVGQISNIKQLFRIVGDCSKNPGLNNYTYNSLHPQYPLYWFGRSETRPPTGPNPRPNPPYICGGSTDVDEVYDLLGNAHNYWQTHFGRNGANKQGGLGWPGGNDPTGSDPATTFAIVHLDVADTTLYYCPNAWILWGQRSLNFCHGTVNAGSVGHEYAHGVLFYSFFNIWGEPVGFYNGWSGALEESFCDVSGELLESELNGGVCDWINKMFDNVPLRNLMSPELLMGDFGLPYPNRFNDPNFYCGTDDAGGVHTNSTVPSKACYLMAMGGSFNGCNIDAIGKPALEQILYRAWTVYAVKSETFNGFYAHMIQSCHDLYDATHPEYVVSVTRALQATEMDQPGYCSGIPGVPPACSVPPRGDANVDATVNISDAVYLISYIFSGGPAPNPVTSGDVDCNGFVNISDAVYLIAYIFSGGPAPGAGCE